MRATGRQVKQDRVWEIPEQTHWEWEEKESETEYRRKRQSRRNRYRPVCRDTPKLIKMPGPRPNQPSLSRKLRTERSDG